MIERPATLKKICHVTSVHPRYDVRIFHKECKSLANNGFDVTLLVNDNLPNEVKEGVKFISTKFKPRNRFERIIKSSIKIRKLMLEIDADIYHFHDPELLPDAIWIKSRKKKVIFDFHENVSQQILFKTWIPRSMRKLISAFYKKYEKNNSRNFDGLITVTPKFVEYLKQINPNTVMITNYPVLKSKVANSEIEKNKSICFAGGISPQWNHENIINAIDLLSDVEYVLAGSGLFSYIEKLKKLPGWSKVRYLGRIPYEEVEKIYSKSMVGMALLSNNTQVGEEGTLGNTKIFEFMEAELPVICSNNKLWKNIIESHDCGICVNPTSVEQIRIAIEILAENVDKRDKYGQNGRKAIVYEFNWSKQEEILLNFYRKL